MAMISCPECGKSVSDRAASCPECGCPISTAAVPAQNSADDVEKLFVLARRARESSDSKNAIRYYNQILDKLPGNWEAIFYTVYYEASECKIMEIASAGNAVANCIFSTFSAINDLEDEKEKDIALNTVIISATSLAGMLAVAAKNHYNQFSTTSGAFSECKNRVVAASNIYSEIETTLESLFPDFKEKLADFRLSYIDFLENNSEFISTIFSIKGLKSKVAMVYPAYGEKIRLEEEVTELNSQISSLYSQMNGLPTERKAPMMGCGIFFLVVGGIMFFVGSMLLSLSGQAWGIVVGILELLIAIPMFIKSPSADVVKQNIEKKNQLDAERNALIAKRDELQSKIKSIEI